MCYTLDSFLLTSKIKMSIETSLLYLQAKSLTKYIPHDDQMKQIREKVQLLEFYPGDTLDIKTGEIHKSFISSDDYSNRDAQKKYRPLLPAIQCDGANSDI